MEPALPRRINFDDQPVRFEYRVGPRSQVLNLFLYRQAFFWNMAFANGAKASVEVNIFPQEVIPFRVSLKNIYSAPRLIVIQ